MSDQPCWHHTINCGSVYFLELKDVTVFIIIMKIIMMIIMMVIKRKKLTANVTFLPRTLTLLNSCAPGPWHQAGACPASGFRLHTVSGGGGPPGSGNKCPSSSKKLMPLVTLPCTFFTSVSMSRKTAYFSFLAWSFFTVTLLCCNIGIYATK